MHDKIEAIVAFCSVASAVVGGFIGSITKSAKEKAQFVTRRELDTKLKDYARADELDDVKFDVRAGFARLETLYHEDKRFQHERDMSLIRRIDEILNDKA